MKPDFPNRDEVDQFVYIEIDSVSHLEALLLLWRNQPKRWSIEAMAQALYVSADVAARILRDLTDRHLIASEPGETSFFYYDSTPEEDSMIRATEELYRKELVRISRLIHSKPSAAVRDFARAFRIKNDRD